MSDIDSHGLVAKLSPALKERTRVLRDAPPRSHTAFVLYTMDGNIRARENQALDSAIVLANELGLPMLVLFELAGAYPYASDRHHRFILEGARDALAAIETSGIATAAYVHRPGHDDNVAACLAAEAAAVVVDDVPTRPYRQRREGLVQTLEQANGGPLFAVDASCVVPMRLVDKPHDRAFKFRQATKALRNTRIAAEWPTVAPEQPRWCGTLPFTPDDLGAWDLGKLTAACDVDHAVPPVPEFPGGETEARARWAEFRDNRLSAYADRRNDALREGHVSRLSPYLRQGMIAATRVAREAAAHGGKGADKFLDELLIWREMSWSYAFHLPDHDRFEAVVPDWAHESLDRRTLDPRPTLYAWDVLARGRTDDALWNAAQAGYRCRGYLHNNLRMTWGKELLNWTDTPEACADLLIDLNNRYSLDGGDPNSYSGLFWCLGGFDRPFEPEQPIFGLVRHRSTAVHAQRLDVARYSAMQSRFAPGQAPRVAVVGAGLSGLMCARTLADHGYVVTVFDKGRRVGGRCATRRLSDSLRADHGAPWFEAEDPRLEPYLQSWRAQGLIKVATDGRKFIPRPQMRALATHLAEDLAIQSGVCVERLEPRCDGVAVHADGQWLGSFDRVVVSAPAPQAAELLAPAAALARQARTATYEACLTAMAAFDTPLPARANMLSGDHPVLGKAIRDSAKPGRGNGEVWVLHANATWSQANLDREHGALARDLLDAFADWVGAKVSEPAVLQGHRWRYGQVVEPVSVDCLFDAATGLGACGDWCPGGGIEGALLSGMAMAGRIFASEPPLAARGAALRERRLPEVAVE